MALTKKFLHNKAKQVRRQADGGSKQGVGDDPHMIVGAAGPAGNNLLIHRSLAYFAPNYSDVKTVIKVELLVRVEANSTHFSYGGKPRIRVDRITHQWSEGTGGEGNWSAGQYEWPSVSESSAVEADIPLNPATGKVQDEAWVPIDITNLWRQISPKGLPYASGAPGQGGANYGLLLRTPRYETDYNQRAIFYSGDNANVNLRPYVLVTYDPLNRNPLAPTLLNPPVTNVTFSDSFEGTHSDPDGDPMAAREIRVWAKGQTTGVPVWPLPPNLQSAASDESQSGRFSVPLSLAAGSLKSQTDYEWDARTQDSVGGWGPYSARRALRITSSAPTVIATNVTTVDRMSEATFGGAYSDPGDTPPNLLAQFQLQMQPVSAHTDVAFSDPALRVWDTGEAIATQDEITDRLVARPYTGRALLPGNYTFRIKVQDSSGVWSPWSYDDFVLTTAYDVDPGNVDLTTQIARNAPVRIALYEVDKGAGKGRGPGKLIGHIDDPLNLGASGFLNSAGEMYFTLPALHPYCPYIEPHSTHYAIEQWYGDRYRAIPEFSGLITDFDAVEDEMIAYGTNYTGLLQTAVDERYNPNKIEETFPAGSHYTNQTIDTVIRDQLTYHKGLADSPVGFITVGPLSALAERVTIFSTYSEALPFITGLIDSHKQGTGREARFYARPKDTTGLNWEWALVEPWGHDRPNIRLEYGSLINDFRVVALGDFGTRVLGVGQKRGEVKVYRKVGLGGLDEKQWGRRAQTRFYADIVDENDLQRRVNEDAAALAKVGKRMAIAIRADMLAPFDGWDLGDSIVIDIVRGVVDTSRYGSLGLWTIYGVEWRYYPDGHSDLTLTILPKKSLTPANPDLIPSVNPGVSREWQTGYGIPGGYGEPPTATPPPGALRSADGPTALTAYPLSDEPVNAKNYLDLNTGCIYELNEDGSSPSYGLYVEVYCPDTSGGGGGLPPDTSPPPVPVIRTPLRSEAVQQDDGTTVTVIAGLVGYDAPDKGTLTDLASIVVESTRFTRLDDASLPDWTLATQWIAAAADKTGLLDTSVIQPAVLSAFPYWWRAYAVDESGNKSGVSAEVTVITATDTDGPPQPTGFVLQAGHKSFGLVWSPILADDVAYTEVRWAIHGTTGWASARVSGTIMVVGGLTNDTLYDVQARSVDRSGNVFTGTYTPTTPPDPISAKADGDPDVGFVSAGSVTPSEIGGNDVSWTPEIMAEVFAGKINADWIRVGTLRAGNAPDLPVPPPVPSPDVQIEVYNALGLLTGTWGVNGIALVNPVDPKDPVAHPGNPNYLMRLNESGLTVYDQSDLAHPIEVVSVTPLGIDAASIRYGSARGGHNLIQNSSFELGAFAVVVPVAATWDVAADWNLVAAPGPSRQGADINITTGANSLSMTSIA